MRNSRILSNSSEYVGYALLLIDSDAAITNTIIADNYVNEGGSGLVAYGSSARLLHSTIARNRGGDSTGIYVIGSDTASSIVTLTNTILVSHAAGISVSQGSTATFTATLWGTDAWGNGTDWSGDGKIITGAINIWGDPDFVNPNAGDYHIGPGSAAIDAGVNAGVTSDIDGEPRPIGLGYDLGADEFAAALAVTKLAAPDQWHLVRH